MHARLVRHAALLFLPATTVAMTLLASACGGKASASIATPTSDPNAAAYTAPPQTAPTATGMPTATAAPTTGTGPATPIAPMLAAPVQPILVSMGQSEAQGAQPDGSPFAGQFAAGQTLEQIINIKGNGCYTIVAASLGIQQLDISLVIQPAPQLQPITVAQSSGAGPNATLGGKGSRPRRSSRSSFANAHSSRRGSAHDHDAAAALITVRRHR